MHNPLATPPPINPIERIDFPDPGKTVLANGVELYMIHAEVQPVVKLEVLFDAGRWKELRESVAQATNVLWREGTRQMSGAEAAERVDFYGATLQSYNSLDHVGFTLYSLEKFIPDVLSVVFDLVLAPEFPQKELDTYVERAVSQLRINADKPDVQGYRLLTEAIFGRSHPYGYNSTEQGLRSITRDDLLQHHRSHYLGGNTISFLSGRISDATYKAVRTQLERLPQGSTPSLQKEIDPVNDAFLHHELPHSLQSSIRLGRLFHTRTHEAYPGVYVLNTVLGGYFGSRLMTELREERGLTYNIYSSVDTMRYGGYLYLSAEVTKGQEQEAMQAIHEELALLRDEPLEEDEMEMVRSYLMGSFLSMVDGPFNTAEAIRTVVTEGAEMQHFDELVHIAKTITADQLQALAKKWLNPEDFVQVTVGPVELNG